MKKIVLVCANGLSTGVLVTKMRDAAAKEGYECTVNAYAVSQVQAVGADADCILIGPQVRYEKDNVQKLLPGKPVEVIDMVAYGRLDGVKVLASAKKLMGD